MLSKKFHKKHIQFYVLEKELERFKSLNLKPKWLKPPELEIVFNSFTFYLSSPPLLFPWSAFFCFNFPTQICLTVTTNEVRRVDCFYRSKNKRVERKFSSRSLTSCIEESFCNQVYRLQEREPEAGLRNFFVLRTALVKSFFLRSKGRAPWCSKVPYKAWK